MRIAILIMIFIAGCFGTAPPPKDKVPEKAASGKFFKLANKVCRPYGGVSFVLPGDKFKAECRDGLKISYDKEGPSILKAEK